jgi:hypothetical protein
MTGEGDRLRFPRGGTVSLANHAVLAAEILGGRRVGIRIEPATLMFYDLDTRELLRVRPNPLTMDQARRLRGSRPAGPPPRPSTEPIQVQRRASNSGVIMVCGQKVALGRATHRRAHPNRPAAGQREHRPEDPAALARVRRGPGWGRPAECGGVRGRPDSGRF